MTNVKLVHSLPADPTSPNGPTIKELNLKLKHRIPIDTLVEVKYDRWMGEGACIKVHARLWVIKHLRDCDGTPLYMLCDKPRKVLERDYKADVDSLFVKRFCKVLEHGFSEDRLKVVERTDEVRSGLDLLCWGEDE